MAYVWPIEALFRAAAQAAAIPSAEFSKDVLKTAASPKDLADAVYAALSKAKAGGSITGGIAFRDFESLFNRFNFNDPMFVEPWQQMSLLHRRRMAGAKRGFRTSPIEDIQFNAAGNAYITGNPTATGRKTAEEVWEQIKAGPKKMPGAARFQQPDFDRVSQLEAEIRHLTSEAGYEPEMAQLSLRHLSFENQRYYRRELEKAYGLDSFVDRRGMPNWIRAPFTDEGYDPRAFGKYSFTRQEARHNPNFGFTVETQMNRQFRPERYSPSSGRLSDIFPISGTMADLHHLRRLDTQRLNGLSNIGSYTLFDIETPGLDPTKGIRQISARFYDEMGNQLDQMNVHFRAPTMESGFFGYNPDGTVRSFEQLARGMEGTFVEDADVGATLKEFFMKANKHNAVVAHNAPFDVSRMQAMLSDPRVAPVLARDKEFQQAVETFFKKIGSNDLIDTLGHARIFIGKGMRMAAEYARDQGTPYSIENIILQTTFLDDIVKHAADKDVARAMIRSTLSRLHSGDIDTWYTHQLLEMLKRASAGDDEVLLPLTAKQQIGSQESIFKDAAEVKAFRNGIVRGGAIVPIGNVHDVEHLSEKYKRFMGDKLDLVKRPTTHLEQMIFETRNLSPIFGEADPSNLIGSKLSYGGIVNPAAWNDVQSRLADINTPFAGLSHAEHRLSQAIGQMGSGKFAEEVDGTDITALRRALSGKLGIGSFEATQAVEILPRSGIAKIPLEMLKELEGKALVGGVSALDTGLLSGRTVFAHGSRFRTGNKTALGLYLRPFRGDLTDQQIAERLSVIRSHLSSFAETGEYGMTHDLVQPVIDALFNSRATAGVQIGVNFNAEKAFNVLGELGEQVSTAKSRFVFPVLGTGGAGRVHVGPAISTVGDQYLKDPNMVKAISESVAATEKLYGNALQSENINRVLMMSKLFGQERSESVAKAIAFHEKWLRPKLTLRNAGLVALAGVGYYSLRKRKQRQKYDETILQQGFENGQDDLGLPSSGRNSLSTAGLVQQLGTQSIGHTRMGPRRHANLYSGVI